MVTCCLAPFSLSHPDFSQRLSCGPPKHIWMLYAFIHGYYMHLAWAEYLTQGQHPRETTLRAPLIDKDNWRKLFGILLLWGFLNSFGLCLKGQKTSILFPIFLGNLFHKNRHMVCLCRCFRKVVQPQSQKWNFFPPKKNLANQLSRYLEQFEGRKQHHLLT